MANERLRSAMAKVQADIEAITRATGVDPKTVQRWLNGRTPHPRHRWAIANLLGEDEGYLWPAARPDLSPGAEATSEVVAAYGHRADIQTRGGQTSRRPRDGRLICSATPFCFSPNSSWTFPSASSTSAPAAARFASRLLTRTAHRPKSATP